MLTKIMKNEWFATYRAILPVYLIMLLFTLIGKFERSMGLFQSDSAVATAIVGLSVFLYFLALFATFLYTGIYLLVRFYKSMFRDEGYLTFTLPVNTSTILIGKVLTMFCYLLLNSVIVAASFFLLAVTPDIKRELFQSLSMIESELLQYGISLSELIVWGVVLTILSTLVSILTAVMSLCIGQLSNTHRVGVAIAVYIGIQIVAQYAFSFLFTGYHLFTPFSYTADAATAGMMRSLLLFLLLFNVVFAAAEYLISLHILKRKLNLL